MSKLPDWPSRDDYAHEDLPMTECALSYERARAEAALARLRCALEALEHVQIESRAKDALWFEAAYDKIVSKTLNEIGPLPPLPDLPTQAGRT